MITIINSIDIDNIEMSQMKMTQKTKKKSDELYEFPRFSPSQVHP